MLPSLSVTDISTSLSFAFAVTFIFLSTERAVNSPVCVSNVYLSAGTVLPSQSVTVTPEKQYSSGSLRANVIFELVPASAKTLPPLKTVFVVLFTIKQYGIIFSHGLLSSIILPSPLRTILSLFPSATIEDASTESLINVPSDNLTL